MVQFTGLRLSGFKSFVDPTEVLIEPGLTGIVGPNGCGKSNLVEALRWVMGETSAKRMRGGEMDDVIFAGTANRPARNIAEIALSLDNSKRRAPAQFNDHEQLEVTRKIERGSGSVYRVNNREVRARDVQLLFADSATGAHSTALVSQGRVGALINAKPADRRALLEEAAGITGLHSRRHEAELRLRAAETNLERLDDVVATMESQYQGLKRQARQATRYRNLANHIRRHEAMVLHLEVEAAQSALAEARTRLEQAETVVASLTERAANCATVQAEAAAQLPGLRQGEAEAAAALQRLLLDRDALDREEARVEAETAQAEERRAQIENDRERARSLAEDARQALARLDQERQSLEAESEGEAEARAEAERQRDGAAEDVAVCESNLAELASNLATAAAKAAALDRRDAELEDRLDRLQERSRELAEARRELAAEREQDVALSTAEAELVEAEGALQQARSAAEAAETDLAQARSREATARDSWQDAKSAHAKVEAEIQALAALLEPAEADIWPPVIDALQVASGYEGALGAALGDDLAAPTDEAAPVHWQTLPRGDGLAALPGGAEPLAGFVSGPQALARRLAQVGVVADVATGERLQAALRPGQRLVTQAGDLWRWDGFTVRAGAPIAATQRLEQRNRLAELRRAAADTESELDALKQDHDAARAAAEQAAAAERAAREQLTVAFTGVSGARETQARLAQQAAAADSRLAAMAEAAERLESELVESRQALEQTRVDREALPDLAAEQLRVDAQRDELGSLRASLSDCQRHLDRLEREAEARSERQSAIDQEASSWQQREEAAGIHIEELEQRLAEVLQVIEALAARPAELAQARDELAALIEAAERSRRDAADALAVAETGLAEADRALKEAERQLAEAREERIRCEGGLSHADQGLSQLALRVRERLECEFEQILELAEVDPSQELPPREQIETKLARLIRERDNMGPVNLRAEQEAAELEQQITSLQSERSDLVSAIARLRQGIGSLNREGRERLLAAFETVNGHFSDLFVRLFGGGRAHLALTEAEDPLDAGLEIMASPPGKRLQVLSLLSGGEQALTALALLFAVFLTNPAPICVLDEVDAPLDDANVDRFCTLVEELAHSLATRFMIITHHRITMARVDRLFGVTMGERGVSQLVSVDLAGAESLRESA